MTVLPVGNKQNYTEKASAKYSKRRDLCNGCCFIGGGCIGGGCISGRGFQNYSSTALCTDDRCLIPICWIDEEMSISILSKGRVQSGESMEGEVGVSEDCSQVPVGRLRDEKGTML